jgi:hypothetical protein
MLGPISWSGRATSSKQLQTLQFAANSPLVADLAGTADLHLCSLRCNKSLSIAIMLFTARFGAVNHRIYFHVQSIGRKFPTSKSCDPLRILFCGSDEFSIASLEALHAERIQRPCGIESIEVVCRPGKRVGRGLKAIREGMNQKLFI